MHLGVGIGQAGADRSLERERSIAAVDLREHFAAYQRHQGQAAEKQDDRRRERALAPSEREFQDASVQHMHLVDAVFDVLHQAGQPGQATETSLCRIAPHRRQHRVERETDEQGHQHRHRDGDAELQEEATDQALHECDRDEYRDNRKRRGHHGQPDFIGAVIGRLQVAFSHAEVAHDVFAHHDRVVDQQADAERQCHQRQAVDGETECPHRNKRGDHGNRQRQAGDDGAAP